MPGNEAVGLEVNEKCVITGGYTQNFGYEAGIKLFNLGAMPTALCTTCDHITLGLTMVVRESSVNVKKL